jgi:hypothetical protein
MVKSLALVLLLCAAFLPVRGQTVPTPPASASSGAYQFCVVTKSSSSTSNFRLEYGQDERNAVANPELAQDDAKIRKMISLPTVLTYLSSRGWEYLSSNSVTLDTHPSFGSEISYNSSTSYLLRRRLP